MNLTLSVRLSKCPLLQAPAPDRRRPSVSTSRATRVTSEAKPSRVAIYPARSRLMSRGEILELKDTINTMVDQLSGFASEVTRVAREVGTEGKLGGQADVPGVAGTWKDLTDNVNLMAGNLTNQVRNIAEVTTAVAKRRFFAKRSPSM